jgi:hypothetical protein
MFLWTDNESSITITDVVLVLGDPGLTIIGGPLFWMDDQGHSIGSALGFPPDQAPDWYGNPPIEMPKEGLVIESGLHETNQGGLQVLYGFRFDGGERATVVGYDVSYLADGREYREFFSSSVAVCSGEDCEAEERGVGRKSPP